MCLDRKFEIEVSPEIHVRGPVSPKILLKKIFGVCVCLPVCVSVSVCVRV